MALHREVGDRVRERRVPSKDVARRRSGGEVEVEVGVEAEAEVEGGDTL